LAACLNVDVMLSPCVVGDYGTGEQDGCMIVDQV